MTKHAKQKAKNLPSQNQPLSDDELQDISAAGTIIGTDERDVLFGTSGDDYISGGDGNDDFRAGAGSDVVNAGDGNDRIDLGYGDGADDIAIGGDGNDQLLWNHDRDHGDDIFDGGNGTDYISLYNLPGDSIQDAITNGLISIELTDSDGNPVAITDDMFSPNGNLLIPDGVNGVMTNAAGSTLTFTDVERIQCHG